MPLPYNIGGADLDNPDWIPVIDSLTESMGQNRHYASMRAYHDRGQFVEAETHNNGRLIGRSVWNTQWYLIIPGSELMGEDPVQGIDLLINGENGTGVRDIKLTFECYGYSGDVQPGD